MKKYLQYKAEQFAEDIEFIKWVRSDFTEYADKWDTFMNDNPSLGDEISEAIDIIELFQFEEAKISDQQRDKLLARINGTVDAEEKAVKVPQPAKAVAQPVKPTTPAAPVKEVATASASESKSILRYLIPIAAAACLGALVLFNMGGSDTATTTNTAAATTTSNKSSSVVTNTTKISETKTVNLPDRSSVKFNATSTVTYDEKTFDSNRAVQLDGEAFFDVTKGEKFTVETPNGSVVVPGTSSFNVVSRGNAFEVACVTGKVNVSGKSGADEVVLSPNESAKLLGKKLIKATTKVQE